MNCPKCGKENPEGGKFCPSCGAPVETAAAPAAEPAAQPAAAPAPGGGKPIPQKTIVIAVVALLAVVGGFLIYTNYIKKDEASVTLQVGDEKIQIGTEDVERAARQAQEEAARLGREAERLGEAAERAAEQAAEKAAEVAGDEPAANAIHGKIVDTGFKKYVVRSLDTGKQYTLNVGRVTTYVPKRKAAVGDVIQATIEYQNGRIVATRIVFE